MDKNIVVDINDSNLGNIDPEEVLLDLISSVAEAIKSSSCPEVDPATYFSWMYCVEPTAEA